MLVIILEIISYWVACGIFVAVFMYTCLQIARLAEYFADKLK